MSGAPRSSHEWSSACLCPHSFAACAVSRARLFILVTSMGSVCLAAHSWGLACLVCPTTPRQNTRPQFCDISTKESTDTRRAPMHIADIIVHGMSACVLVSVFKQRRWCPMELEIARERASAMESAAPRGAWTTSRRRGVKDVSGKPAA